MIFIFNHTALIILKAASVDLEPGYVLALFFFIGLLVFRAYVQYQKELSQELGADVSDYELKDVHRIRQSADEILNTKNSYYARLSSEGKVKFQKRLQGVLANKTFYAKEGLKLTDEMTVLAASAFVQISFGLSRGILMEFDKIYIYPDLFFNKLLDRNLKGSTSPLGIIRFSWKHLEHGFARDDDGINLALHELAHAFKITVETDDSMDVGIFDALKDLQIIGGEVRSQVLKGKTEVLRKYAAVNDHEFFACAVEVFFENPEELKADQPKLLSALINVLEQDPSNRIDDYAAPEVRRKFNFKHEIAIKPDGHYSFMQWMMVIGLVIILVPIFMIKLHADSSPVPTLLFVITVLTLGVIRYYRKLVVSGYTSPGIFIVFLLLGWFPLIGGPALVMNFLIPVYSTTEYVAIKNADYIGDHEYEAIPIDADDAHYVIDGNVYGEIKKCNGHCLLEVRSHYGVFGLEVIDDYSVIQVSEKDSSYTPMQ